MQGPSSFSCFFIIKNTDFDTPQQSLMPVVLPRSCMTLLIVFLQLILPIREVSSLKRSKVKSVSRTSSSTIHLVPMFPLSRIFRSLSPLERRSLLSVLPVPESRLSFLSSSVSMIPSKVLSGWTVLISRTSTLSGSVHKSVSSLRNPPCLLPLSGRTSLTV